MIQQGGDCSFDENMQQQRFKRRRFAPSDDSMGVNTENSQQHPFLQFQSVSGKGNSSLSLTGASASASTSTHGPSMKRSRPDNTQIEYENRINSQGVEISNLKSDKAVVEKYLSTARKEHDKVVQENRTLKRAVLIQQERQNQATSELQTARQYKVEAEDKIKKLEQIVLSLRYHLQTQQNNTPNDFMEFRPPHVF